MKVALVTGGAQGIGKGIAMLLAARGAAALRAAGRPDQQCRDRRAGARGAIVNIASTRALQSEPHTEAYAAAKGGVLALTHAMAISLGPASPRSSPVSCRTPRASSRGRTSSSTAA